MKRIFFFFSEKICFMHNLLLNELKIVLRCSIEYMACTLTLLSIFKFIL